MIFKKNRTGSHIEKKKTPKIKTFIDLMSVRMQNSEIGVTSSVVAYYLLLSFFPLLIAVGNILPLFHFNQNTGCFEIIVFFLFQKLINYNTQCIAI